MARDPRIATDRALFAVFRRVTPVWVSRLQMLAQVPVGFRREAVDRFQPRRLSDLEITFYLEVFLLETVDGRTFCRS